MLGSYSALGCTRTVAAPVCSPRLRTAPRRLGSTRGGGVGLRASSHQDRDHPDSHPFDDPHQTPPPRSYLHQEEQHPLTPAPASGSSGGAAAGVPPHAEADADAEPASASDLEFGSDAFSGGSLETRGQLDSEREAFEKDVEDTLFMSTRDADEARAEEAVAATSHHQELTAHESTAEEREERYEGILQAIEDLQAKEQSQGGEAADQDSAKLSPEAARLMSDIDEKQGADKLDALRHVVDELGEGEEVAELVMKSYQGRDLDEEVRQTLDPDDPMPHPGDKYLPRAAKTRESTSGGMEARVNHTHARSDVDHRRVLLMPPARGASSTANGGAEEQQQQQLQLVPPSSGGGGGADPAAARHAQRDPVTGGGEESANDQIGLGSSRPAAAAAACGTAAGEEADDQIGWEQDALMGADALYYTAEHAANPAVNDVGGGHGGGGGRSAGNIEAPETFDIEGDALCGSDAMFYYKSACGGGGGGGEAEAGLMEGRVWGALYSRDEEHSSFRRAMEEAASHAASNNQPGRGRGTGIAGGGNSAGSKTGSSSSSKGGSTMGAQEAAEEAHHAGGGVLQLLRRRQAERRQAEEGLGALAHRLKEGRRAPEPKPASGLGRVLEVAVGRAAAVGLGSAFVTELLTQQSVVSQLLGRYEGHRQIEFALPAAQGAATAVLAAAVLLTVLERMAGRGTPRLCLLGFSPTAQVWLGRATMAAFAMLLAYETVHSNRPAFGTLFYLWF